MGKQQRNSGPSLGYLWFVLIFIFVNSMILAFVASFFVEDSVDFSSGNVAVIPIHGVILAEGDGSVWGDVASSTDIVELIEEAADTNSVKGIVLEINSPGGSPVASDEIALAVERANKTTVAWIREVGASGGYWIASSADHIVANRMSITGSIGVIASYLDYSGLLSRYNVSYERMVAGKYKDLGTPLRELTPKERELFQDRLDELHDYFKTQVAEQRGLSNAQINAVSTGIFYLGGEAKELGLVDELGGKQEALSFIERTHNITADPVTYEPQVSLYDLFSAQLGQHIGFGFGQAVIASHKYSQTRLSLLS